MLQPGKTKICLVGESLYGGGAEKAMAFLSNYLYAAGIEVHIIIVQDIVGYDYSGTLLNLGKHKNDRNDVFDKFRRLRVLKAYLKKHQFDYIIDYRIRVKPLQDLIISKYIFTAPTIYSIRSAKLLWYLPKQKWLAKLMYGNAYGIHCINTTMRKMVENNYGLNNVKTIFNALDIGYIEKKLQYYKTPESFSYILAMGRMGDDNVKQFDRLIESYSASVLPEANVKLLIAGEGVMKPALEALAGQKGLEDKVVFLGFQQNPYVYMREALFFVLCSKFEGTPMVLLESLACGTPVVSFNCQTGPSEIIDDKQNGLLVPDQDFEELTKRMNLLYSDKQLYGYCKANATASAAKFSYENVGRQWLDYLNIKTT